MMFAHATGGGGIGAPVPEWVAVTASMLPRPTARQLNPFTQDARSQNIQSPRTGMYGLGTADPGIMSGLTILAVLGVIGVGLWAFSGKKHHRRHYRY